MASTETQGVFQYENMAMEFKEPITIMELEMVRIMKLNRNVPRQCNNFFRNTCDTYHKAKKVIEETYRSKLNNQANKTLIF
jgi:hypothetical protein